MNIGEEIVAAFLQVFKHCEFVELNRKIPNKQGDIDVIGIDINKKILYVCEVTIHILGLQYVNSRDKQPENVERLVKKFSKSIEYVQEHYKDYKINLMFWSPIVKNQKEGSKHNQLRDIEQLKQIIKDKYNLEVFEVINEKFLEYFNDLRKYASENKIDFKSPVLRLLQIEEHAKKHVQKIAGGT